MKRNLVIAIISLLLTACGGNVVYTQFKSLPVKGWEADSLVTFEPVINDTLANYEMQITIRHTDAYPYQNMWLFVGIEKDSTVLLTDTIEFYLANDRGEWLGGGLTVKELPLLYRESHQFANSGTYRITLQQGMREETLKGITEVGVQILSKE
jgi:gliding motility-associated lipoprotein GldH